MVDPFKRGNTYKALWKPYNKTVSIKILSETENAGYLSWSYATPKQSDEWLLVSPDRDTYISIIGYNDTELTYRVFVQHYDKKTTAELDAFYGILSLNNLVELLCIDN